MPDPKPTEGVEVPLGFGRTALITRDGREVAIRHMTLADGLLLAELYASLSLESRYLRFFTPRGIPDERVRSEAIRMADIDPLIAIGLLVIAKEQGREWVVGEARLIRDAQDSLQAEVAMLVRDGWQHQGIGEALFDILIQTGLVQGLERVYALTLSLNQGMRRLVQNLGLAYSEVRQGSETTFWIALLGDQPRPPLIAAPGTEGRNA
ncbi:MAG: hypothetical protein NVSMB42_26900 [Herpetosiphon sp.]